MMGNDEDEVNVDFHDNEEEDDDDDHDDKDDDYDENYDDDEQEEEDNDDDEESGGMNRLSNIPDKPDKEWESLVEEFCVLVLTLSEVLFTGTTS
ncbi:hypothetical protein AWC38_SpisGene21299 [Stylophora pistillata]|uniref:Uncharacterized protein n=1 Tax=Stylophora pistillata TaxID=50429 RepID=A0A2B4R865_STYPI|nr:hypothetical protein AWC38_SpisGene21299 [Stylophora pistillata]